MNPHRLRAYILLVIVIVIWAIAGPVIKLTLDVLSPSIFLLYRFFLSSLGFLFLLPFTGLHIPKNPKLLLYFIIYGILVSPLSLGLLFWGTAKTSLLDMSLISIFGPVLTIVAGYFFLKDHITAKEKVGIFIAFIGSLVILIEPFITLGNGSGQVAGNLLVFGSLVAGSASAIFVKKLLREGVDPLSLVNVSFVIGFLSIIPIVLLKTNPSDLFSLIKNLPIPYHLGVFYMALISGTLAYYLGNVAQKSIEVSEAALFSYIYPVFSAILAIILLGEKVSTFAAIGSLITILGVAIAEIKKKRYNSEP